MRERSLICSVCGTEFVTGGGPRVCRCPSCQREHTRATQDERYAIYAEEARQRAIENQEWKGRKLVVLYDPSPEECAFRPGAMLSKKEVIEAAKIGNMADGMRFEHRRGSVRKLYVLRGATLVLERTL